EIIDALPLAGALLPAASSARWPDGSGNIVTSARATPGALNAAPPPSAAVVSEVLYHGTADSKAEEFIEIHSRSKSPLPLKGWRFERAVDFGFPDDAVLPPGGYAVVAGDPVKLRERLALDEKAIVLGPYKGTLSNRGDVIVLRDAEGNEVDRVPYHDRDPWPSGADGGGHSLELIHPGLDNRWAQAWALGPRGGTPGQKNVRSVTSMPPAIASVRHEPAVPGPDDTVVVHAHVLDTGSISEVAVIYQDLNGGSAFVKKAMSDNGGADDGAARDGHYAVRLPRFRPGTLVAFAVMARDSSGKVTRVPEEGQEGHFQVEPARGSQRAGRGRPVYRVLMARDAWDRFLRNPRSNAWLPCTFIPSVEGTGVNEWPGRAHYGASIRFRGSTSRNPRDGRMSYRLKLKSGDLHDGRSRFILNAYESHRQKAGSDVLRLAGVPVSDVAVVRLKTPSFDDSRYADVEVINSDFLDRRFGSSEGELYRGRRGRKFGADLAYHGPDPQQYLDVYTRVNKKKDPPGQSSIVKLLEALRTQDPAAYPKRVAEAIDVEEWALYFAVNNVLGNTEGGISTDQPDDFFLAQRPSDGRFLLVAWDQDSTFDSVTQPLFRPALPAVRRFLQHPSFAPYYQKAVRELIDDVLSLEAVERRFAALSGIYTPETLHELTTFVRRRQSYLRERGVAWPGASIEGGERGSLPSGFGSRIFLADPEDGGGSRAIELNGALDPAEVFGVRVGGTAGRYDAITGRWSASRPASSLSAGPNPIWLEVLGPTDQVVVTYPLNLEKVPAFQAVPPEIDDDVEWTAARGPFLLDGGVTVRPGSTLRIGPGVNVVCMRGSSLTVNGALAIEGDPLAPVVFRPAGRDHSWVGIRLRRGGSDSSRARHKLSHTRFEGGRNPGSGSSRAEPRPGLRLPRFLTGPRESEGERPSAPERGLVDAEGTSIRLDHCVFRGIGGAALGGKDSLLDARGLRITDGRSGIVLDGGVLRLAASEICRLHGDGVKLRGAVGDGSRLSDCAFRDVLGTAIEVEGGRAGLEDVLVHGCGAAMALRRGARVQATRVTFAGNSRGVSFDVPPEGGGTDGGVRAGGQSLLELDASVLGAHVDLWWPPGARPSKLEGSVIAPGSRGAAGAKGDGLILAPPRFRAPCRGDFQLEPGSPGHGSGPNGSSPGHHGARKGGG
ncbi:MAG TPA: CotH kinase family protein, partial [Planctomycetota bacterium]|nr:CotH kinase family protein [Planctomycetota bacterium]